MIDTVRVHNVNEPHITCVRRLNQIFYSFQPCMHFFSSEEHKEDILKNDGIQTTLDASIQQKPRYGRPWWCHPILLPRCDSPNFFLFSALQSSKVWISLLPKSFLFKLIECRNSCLINESVKTTQWILNLHRVWFEKNERICAHTGLSQLVRDTE